MSQKCKKHLIESNEKRLLSLIHTHYSRYSIFFKIDDEELRKTALAELQPFFHGKNEDEIYGFLWNWYDNNIWSPWGRRDYSKIALSGNTMKGEAHWWVLKRLHLLPYKRPRVDSQLSFIGTKLVPKQIANIIGFRNGQICLSGGRNLGGSGIHAWSLFQGDIIRRISSNIIVLFQRGCEANTSCARRFPMSHVYSIVISPYDDSHRLMINIQRRRVV